jgi:hypothetical protein
MPAMMGGGIAGAIVSATEAHRAQPGSLDDDD